MSQHSPRDADTVETKPHEDLSHGAGILLGTENKAAIKHTRQPQTARASAKEKNWIKGRF